MRIICKAKRPLAAAATLLITMAALAVSSPATMHAQGNDTQVDLIECRTYIGEDAQQPADLDQVLIQGQHVTVRCAYIATPGNGATILAINSELLTWKGRIAHYRNRKELDDGIATFHSMDTNADTLTPYQTVLENLEIIKIEVMGTAPEAIQKIPVDTGSDSQSAYHHVQKPNEFEALSVNVEAAASQDRHSHRLTTTTQRWQDINNRLNRYIIKNQRDDVPPYESVMAKRLLAEGYPNLADAALDDVATLNNAKQGFLKRYQYYAIGGVAIVLALIATITVVTWRAMSKDDDGLDDLQQ